MSTPEQDLQESRATPRSRLNEGALRRQVLPTWTTNQADARTEKARCLPNTFVVGAVLGPESAGGLGSLVSAFSSLRQRIKSARLVIFGAANGLFLSTWAAQPELCQGVHWESEGPRARDLLQGCDVLVSLQKGVPLLVLQAMSSRIPVITTAIRVPEVIQHERTAIRIRRGDRNSLEKALLQLAEQPNRRLMIGAAAQEGIARQYSETNLWHTYPSHGTNEQGSKFRGLIGRVLFSTIPKEQLFQHGSRERAQIALTIDDGPDPVYTPQILEMFSAYGVRATFFVVGNCAEQYPDIVRRIADEGHEVGNHSYSHPYFQRLSWTGAAKEIRMTNAILNRILGKKCHLFRPPFGKLSLQSLIPAWGAGQHVVMWSVDLKDYRGQTGEVEAKLARTVFSSGEIILYHGVSEAALKALPRVIESALDGGRKAVTISELIQP
jgi:peptidoglycan/xylan/chitin deacetylase (PgdA/CDA1 family)